MEVTSFRALRTKAKSATVTYWNGKTGVCGNQVFFSMEVIQNGTNIQVGAKVNT